MTLLHILLAREEAALLPLLTLAPLAAVRPSLDALTEQLAAALGIRWPIRWRFVWYWLAPLWLLHWTNPRGEDVDTDPSQYREVE